MTTPMVKTELSEEEFRAWFKDRFFDVREHKPQKGQVLSRYRAVAHFVDAWVKRNVINMLVSNPVGAESAVKVLHKMCGATEADALRVALEMSDDLIGGMTEDEVAAAEYKMIIEFFFWVEPQYVPDDPHWSKIELLNSELDSKIKAVHTTED